MATFRPTWRALSAALLLTLPSLAAARVFRCRPTVKYECSEQRCLRVTEGFQHAESFTWDDARRRLTACLWSRCYQGTVSVHRDAAGVVTAFGPLVGEPAGGAPLYLSITVGADGKFTAVWEQRSDGLVFDVGRCEGGAAPRPATPAPKPPATAIPPAAVSPPQAPASR